MINFKKLREKFPAKNPKKVAHAAAIKSIAREYAHKRAELGLQTPDGRHGFPYYMAVLMGMMLVGAIVVPRFMKHAPKIFNTPEELRAKAEKDVKTLAIALGRFRYHTGRYPTTEQGLLELLNKKSTVKGNLCPYLKALTKDPWQNDYVYADCTEEGEFPTLFSMGPDGQPGTSDDVIASEDDFDEPFRDASWSVEFVPHHLRGYVLVVNERHRAQIEADLEKYLYSKTGPLGCRVITAGWEFAQAWKSVDPVADSAAHNDPGWDSEELSWQPVLLPHDWAAEAPVAASGESPDLASRLPWRGVGYYRRRGLYVSGEAAGKLVLLRFNGVAAKAEVQVNGHRIDGPVAGPTGFDLDISDAVSYGGGNDIVVRVDTTGEDIPHYAGAGLIGDVALVVEEREGRLTPGSLALTPLEVTEGQARMQATYRLPDGEHTEEFTVARPITWMPDHPYLHRHPLLGEEVSFGIRTVAAAPDGGLLLNGETVKVKGVRLKAEGGPMGGAFRRDDVRRTLEQLKDMGANAIWPAGSSVDPGLLDLCDEMGFLVWCDGLSGEDGRSCSHPCLVGKLDPADFIVASDEVLDLSGAPTARFALYRALWNERVKTIDLQPHWNWGADGTPVTLACATDGDTAELFVNGQSAGVQTRKAAAKPEDCRFSWDVPYEEGEVKVIVQKDGLYHGEKTLQSALRAKAARLTAERVRVDDGETAWVKIETVDDAGVVLPQAAEEITLELEGPGELIAVVAGDDYTVSASPRTATCRLVNGRAVVALRRLSGSGRPVKLTAKVGALPPVRVKIQKYWPYL